MSNIALKPNYENADNPAIENCLQFHYIELPISFFRIGTGFTEN